MKLLALFFSLLFTSFLNAQDMKITELPYAEIPEYPDNYTASTVAARMIDGLGFRYYWATDGLNDVDLKYKPSENGRTNGEIIDHIFSLSKIIVNATLEIPNDGFGKDTLSFIAKRKATLLNFKKASDILLKTESLEDLKIIFKSDTGIRTFPFWNNINGPISDALWHTGQVVMLRRASGNPFNSKVNVFSGKVKE